jgi:hypothetical protein
MYDLRVIDYDYKGDKNMADHKPVETCPKAEAHAHEIWSSFTRLSLYAIYAAVIVLVTLAVMFVQW